MPHLKLILTALFCLSTAVEAADMVVALSPYQSSVSAEQQVKTVLKTFCAMPPASMMTVMDGYALQTLAMLKVPDNPRYQHCKTRLKLNGAAIGAVMGFAKTAGQAQHEVSQAVLLPQLLHHVTQMQVGPKPLDVIVFGSPLYHDERSPTYSMAEGLIPSDGHFKHGRADTPFGIDDSNALAGVRVHLAYDAETIFTTDQHRNLVQRFWALYMSEQGGALLRFTADKAALLNGLHAPAKKKTYTAKNTDKLDMIRLRQDDATQTIYERPLSSTALPVQNLSAASDVEIGVTWSCNACDIDLYARPSPEAEVLFFNNSKTAQGLHLKDFTSAPQTKNGFETIVFNGTIDLDSLEIVINFYNGTAAKDVHGTLRLAANGEVYASKRGFTEARHECAYLLVKGQPAKPEKVLPDVMPWGRYTGNRLHPTQKPLEILRPLIRSYSKVGDVVLDPFAGSGSTLLAAHQLRRSWVGIELDETYHRNALNRLNARQHC